MERLRIAEKKGRESERQEDAAGTAESKKKDLKELKRRNSKRRSSKQGKPLYNT